MKICVLQPDYSGSAVDYRHYDPPRDLSALMPEAEFHHAFLNKLTTYRQIRELSKQDFDIFVNLCEGYLEWDVPSIDVIHTLEMLRLPFTGPSSKLYDPPKDLMKYVSYCVGIRTPDYVIASSVEDLSSAGRLSFPLFVKPLKAGDSLGIDESSRCVNEAQLAAQAEKLLRDYDAILVEECIDGREFSVLVAADPAREKECISFTPVEFLFPPGVSYKTYALKTSELHPGNNRPCDDLELELGLRDAAERVFKAFQGVGYARLDFRVNSRREIFFLEINFTCSVFYSRGYEGTADYILQFDGIGQGGFLRHIIAEGMARHESSKKSYVMKGDAISGFGIHAVRDIGEGEVIFRGEERAQRFVTRRHVSRNWEPVDKKVFAQYAYPVSGQVYCLWDDDPSEWAPQNHCCTPNTRYEGLNVVAVRRIEAGEELTLDYASFLDETAEGFECRCNSPGCRKFVRGSKGNSVTSRELELISGRHKRAVGDGTGRKA